MNTFAHIFDGGSGRPLSPRAEKLARYLMDHPNRIHRRADLAAACGFEENGRSSDTYMSEIRKCLGTIDRIVSAHGTGYGWMGEPVPLVAVVKGNAYVPRNDEMVRLAIMTQVEVAKLLGITPQAVNLIEKKALAKIRRKPEIKQAWQELKSYYRRVQYDPFHEIWLFQVAEKIGSQSVDSDNETEPPLRGTSADDSRTLRE